MSWLWGAFVPHPPVLLPQIGRGREKAAVHTLAGARALLAKLSALPGGGRPDFLFILSPHRPHAAGALMLGSAPVSTGGLKFYGAPKISFSLTTPLELLAALTGHLAQAGLKAMETCDPDLSPDHGTLVPLQQLRRLMPDPPPAILANPIGLTLAQALALGRSLAAFSPPGLTGALLASGDLSHRLSPRSPAGFHPAGAEFDRALVAALTAGAPENLIAQWPPERLADAGVCGAHQALILMGLAGGPLEVLSYEAPFGVGYCHALWRPPAD